MKQATANFLRLLDSKDIKYKTGSDDNKDWVSVRFNCKNASGITANLFFGSETDLQLSIFAIAKVPDEKIGVMLLACNQLMNQYRWLRFYLDGDHEIVANADAIITPDTATEVGYELMMRAPRIVDDVYPKLTAVRLA